MIAEQARTRFTPRAIIFVGVAGSLKPDVRLGDVVVASRIYAYDGAKHVSDEVLARPAAWAASHDLLQAAKHALRGTEWTGPAYVREPSSQTVRLRCTSNPSRLVRPC